MVKLANQRKFSKYSKKGSGKLLIYDKVKEICKEKNISIASVEKKAGLGNGAITKWNSSSPTVDNLKVVADILEVTVDELIE